MENKELFAKRISEALVECGAGRYDRLKGAPLVYEKRGGEEAVKQGASAVNVTGDSLAAMMVDMAKLFR